MTPRQKLLIAGSVTGIVITAAFVGHLWTRFELRRLERNADVATERAERLAAEAARLETEAAGFKQKAEYLEAELRVIRTLAKKQDEELEKLTAITSSRRDDVERARRTRAIAATADELCERLAALGHPCWE